VADQDQVEHVTQRRWALQKDGNHQVRAVSSLAAAIRCRA
jgi:hypothetical protein